MVPLPRSRYGAVRFGVKSFGGIGPTTVRLHSELEMFSPYRWVFGVWLSFDVLETTELSLHVMLSAAVIRMPSRPEVTFALFVIVLYLIWFRSPLTMSMPSRPAWSMTLFLTMLSLDFLFGWSATVDDLVSWMPMPPTRVIVQRSTRL